MGVAGTGGKHGVDLRRVREAVQIRLHAAYQKGLLGSDFLRVVMVPRLWTKAERAAQPFRRDFRALVAPWVWDRNNADHERLLTRHSITVLAADFLRPVLDFSEVDFGPELNPYVADTFRTPFPLQSLVLPAILSGRDAVVLGPAQSGKTFGALLAALPHVLDQPPVQPGEGPVCLILAPSRELVQAITEDLERFEFPAEIQVGGVYGGREGGGGRYAQSLKVFSGCEILVGTPGRTLELWQAQLLSFDRVTLLVLAEAVHLLADPMTQQVRNLVDQLRPDRQTVLLSSTWDEKAEAATRQFLEDPIKITVGNPLVTPIDSKVHQRFVFPPPSRQDREDMLVDVLKDIQAKNPDCSRTLVFVMARPYVDHLVQGLSGYFPAVFPFRGGLSEEERLQAVTAVRTDPRSILVTTDAALSALDLPDVRCVVNFQLPYTLTTYAARLSHTGRGGSDGTAVSFVTPTDGPLVQELIDCLTRIRHPIPTRLYDFLPRNQQPGPSAPYPDRPRTAAALPGAPAAPQPRLLPTSTDRGPGAAV